MKAYPTTWSIGKQLLALDEALVKANVLRPAEALNHFIDGLQSWTSQWTKSPAKSNSIGITVPNHLRRQNEFQQLWAIDRDLQVCGNTNIITAAPLRLTKVKISEHYEDMKTSMRLPSVRRKRGQSAASKAKEVIFGTTFPDPKVRSAALRRFESAQVAASALLDLCRDHSYGVLILIPPTMGERSFRPTAVEFEGFRAALRFVLGQKWTHALNICGKALLLISQGREPQQAIVTELRELHLVLQGTGK